MRSGWRRASGGLGFVLVLLLVWSLVGPTATAAMTVTDHAYDHVAGGATPGAGLAAYTYDPRGCLAATRTALPADPVAAPVNYCVTGLDEMSRTTYDGRALRAIDSDSPEISRAAVSLAPQVREGPGVVSALDLPGVVAANTAARACSFAGSTTVLMADGTRKPIQDVKVGDRVVATDPETGEQVPKTVEHVFVHGDTVIDLVVDGEVITTTEDHPFWSVTDQRFERADELSSGEKVLSADGRVITVSGLELGTARKALAYNLSVEGIHTYHVGEDAILVHNTCSLTQRAEELAARAGRNRVSAETPTGRLSVDLQGRAHYEKTLGRSVDTPHTKFETRHIGPNGQVSYGSGPVRPATYADLRIIDRILSGRGL